MRYALLACAVAFLFSGAASAQSTSQLPRRWTPSRAEMAAVWASEGNEARPLQDAARSSWEAVRNVPSGTMVRVGYSEPGNRYVEVEGELIEWQPEAIQVGTRPPKRLEKEQVRSVWRLEAHRSRGQRAAIGALVGFGLGFALGYAGSPRDAGAAPPAVGGFLVGGVFGGVGGLIRSGKYHSVLVYTAAAR